MGAVFAAPPSVRGSTLTSFAFNGDTFVGFDTSREPYAWFSATVDIWNPSDLTPSYGVLTTDSTFNTNGFAAAGRGCCGLPDQRFGVIVRSTDGQTWTAVRPEHFAQPVEAIATRL